MIAELSSGGYLFDCQNSQGWVPIRLSKTARREGVRNEVHLEGPGDEGHHQWVVRFPGTALELAHEEPSFAFGFRSAPPPEHTVTVEVIGRDAKSPLEMSLVVVNPYRAQTDEAGVARIAVPKGEYDLNLAKNDYTALRAMLELGGDLIAVSRDQGAGCAPAKKNYGGEDDSVVSFTLR